MVKLFTKPLAVEAVLVGDVMRTPEGDWTGLPNWLRTMHERGNLKFRTEGVVMVDMEHVKTMLFADDWIVQDSYGSIYAVSSDDFQNRFYPREDAPPAPFAVGDIVSLTSGGFAMTVEDCRRSCAPGDFLIDVLWSGNAMQSEFSRETLPAACLIGSRARNDDNIPF